MTVNSYIYSLIVNIFFHFSVMVHLTAGAKKHLLPIVSMQIRE
jgi:hypothetical protein